ncbi:MAG TPA: ROK family protein [Planctomycetes bacterium]|nr:ROK family protein [Planctomycetota bacterium]
MADVRERYYAGVDLGGTNVRAAIVVASGEVRSEVVKVPTPKDKGPDAVMDAIVEIIRGAVDAAGVELAALEAIGIGSPGPLNSDTGRILYTPNLEGFENYPVTERIMKATGRSAVLEGDANVACYGEWWMGAGRGTRSMVMFTLGTGVGGGIVLDGGIWRGPHYTAGHLGHIIIDPEGPPCGCGARGCLEAFASATAVARSARDALAASGRNELGGVPLDKITSREVAIAAAAGDGDMQAVLADAGRILGRAFVDVANVIDPELIVVGGGMVDAGEHLLGPAVAVLRKTALYPPREKVRVEKAALGDMAGIIGAAGCARKRYATSR